MRVIIAFIVMVMCTPLAMLAVIARGAWVVSGRIYDWILEGLSQ